MYKWWIGVFSIIYNACFPRSCPFCHSTMEDRQSLICPECQDVVREYYLIREPVCKKCGKEVSIPEQEFCLDCSIHSHNFEQAICVFRYGRKMLSVKGIEQFPEWKKKTFYLHSMGESLQYFKYKNAKEYADYYIRELIGQYGVWLRQIQADAIVPVPIHWTRKRRRGYNQAKILSDKLSKILDVPVLDGYLKRIHRTSPQKGLGRQQRTKNLMEAFAVTRALPKSTKTVLLIDDIYTTGATMEVCSRRLKQAGVEKVYCVSICGGQE